MPSSTAVPIGGVSRLGTIDPAGKNRVYTDEFMKEVGKDSADAAFVFKRGEYERLKARREELGLNVKDDALRSQLASARAAQAAAKRAEAASAGDSKALAETIKLLEARVAELEGNSKAAPKATATAAPADDKAKK